MFERLSSVIFKSNGSSSPADRIPRSSAPSRGRRRAPPIWRPIVPNADYLRDRLAPVFLTHVFNDIGTAVVRKINVRYPAG